MIRVMLVDDSMVALTVLQRLLLPAPDIQVVAVATGGEEALTLFRQERPDVVCTDLSMPGMDGTQLTRALLAIRPVPILVVSVLMQPDNQAGIFEVLEAGAVDVFPKPQRDDDGSALCRKIRVVAGVRVVRRRTVDAVSPSEPSTRPHLVAIGASTGGPSVLRELLGGLPSQFSVPIVCVQHISPGFLPGLVKWLDSHCNVSVRVASQGAALLPGVVWFAPDDVHLEVRTGGSLGLSTSMPEALCSEAEQSFPVPSSKGGPSGGNRSALPASGHRPSITVLFNSVARVYGSRGAGLLLTGMGEDGVAGLLAMARAGALTMAQDEASSVVYGMPRRAVETGAAHRVCSPQQMERYLLDIGGG